MRAIDADELKNKAFGKRGGLIHTADIDAMPTIEERKTGKWIEIGTITHSYKCSVCGRMLVSITDGKNKVVEHYPFCHCGARMVLQEGEDNEQVN